MSLGGLAGIATLIKEIEYKLRLSLKVRQFGEARLWNEFERGFAGTPTAVETVR